MGFNLLAQIGVVRRPTEDLQPVCGRAYPSHQLSRCLQHPLNRANHAIELGSVPGRRSEDVSVSPISR